MRMSRPLFSPESTHAVVRCWQCAREVTVTPAQLPAGITAAEFGKRAICKGCGANWPQVTVYPTAGSVWDRQRGG
jgi:hypothetical protein